MWEHECALPWEYVGGEFYHDSQSQAEIETSSHHVSLQNACKCGSSHQVFTSVKWATKLKLCVHCWVCYENLTCLVSFSFLCRGLTILRTYSPEHYEGGAWNTGGSCTGKTQPLTDKEVAENSYMDTLYSHQMAAVAEAEKIAVANSKKLRVMDITKAFSYRADGHPGPYRNHDPNKQVKRGPDGKPPPQDCLHWCMPGPIDTWNEYLLAMLKQELWLGKCDFFVHLEGWKVGWGVIWSTLSSVLPPSPWMCSPSNYGYFLKYSHPVAADKVCWCWAMKKNNSWGEAHMTKLG